jgi:signal transduction histidine kinase
MTREGGDLVLTVRDTGRGLLSGAPPEGTGLGLPTVRALCAAHGGDFTIANAPGGGAIATARLPIALAD